jgi:hypothetical protein
MLDHGRDPALHQTIHRRLPESGNRDRILRKGAVTNDIVGTGMAQVEAWRAIGIKAERRQFMGQEPMVYAHSFKGRSRISGIERAERLSRTPIERERWTQTLNPPPLLIDKDQGPLIIGSLSQGRNQGAGLVGRLDIAGKEDEPPWPHIAEKGPFLIAQDRSSAAKDTGP